MEWIKNKLSENRYELYLNTNGERYNIGHEIGIVPVGRRNIYLGRQLELQIRSGVLKVFVRNNYVGNLLTDYGVNIQDGLLSFSTNMEGRRMCYQMKLVYGGFILQNAFPDMTGGRMSTKE